MKSRRRADLIIKLLLVLICMGSVAIIWHHRVRWAVVLVDRDPIYEEVFRQFISEVAGDPNPPSEISLDISGNDPPSNIVANLRAINDKVRAASTSGPGMLKTISIRRVDMLETDRAIVTVTISGGLKNHLIGAAVYDCSVRLIDGKWVASRVVCISQG
jgi:hypothetical protein